MKPVSVAFAFGALPLFMACGFIAGNEDLGPQIVSSIDGGERDGAIDTGLSGSAYARAVTADAPVAYLRLGESVTPAVKDEMGRHPATYQGAVQLGEPGAIAGDPDTAARFKSGGAVNVSTASVFDFAGKASYSVEFWAKRSGDQGILGKASYAPDAGYKGLFAAYRDNGPGDLSLEFFRGPTPVRALITDNRFYHVVVVYDGVTLSLFLDGKLAVAAVSNNALPGTLTALRLGSIEQRGVFDGLLDEVAIYDKALTPSQVQAHYMAAQPR